MIEKEVEVVNRLGLHARAAAKLVSLASSFASSIQVEKDGRRVNGKSIMGVMMLAASQHSIIRLYIDGEDEHEAFAKIQALIAERFGEDQ